MIHSRALSIVASGLVCIVGCATQKAPDVSATPVPDLSALDLTVVDLKDVTTSPSGHPWFDFRPNLKKLILSGAPETQHVALLWYTVTDGSVGLHLHSKTESVYVIDGTQTDAKGVYPTGTVYFNPPGSGHSITNSSGFFILAYASPPDFKGTERIQEYTPLRIDTADPNFTSAHPFEQKKAGVRTFQAPLDGAGGMSAEFIELTAPGGEYEYRGNYLLVLQGSCSIEGASFGKEMLLVAKAVVPQPFHLTAETSCLAMGISF